MTWTSDYGEQRACPKGLGASGPRGLKPIYYSILFATAMPILRPLCEATICDELYQNTIYDNIF